jgi:hypothetical protein
VGVLLVSTSFATAAVVAGIEFTSHGTLTGLRLGLFLVGFLATIGIAHSPLLNDVGLSIQVYEETPGWAERVYPTFAALVGVTDALTAEMGESAASSVLLEAALTVSTRPYARRVLIIAERSL